MATLNLFLLPLSSSGLPSLLSGALLWNVLPNALTLILGHCSVPAAPPFLLQLHIPSQYVFLKKNKLQGYHYQTTATMNLCVVPAGTRLQFKS